jgi:hypothetical protein
MTHRKENAAATRIALQRFLAGSRILAASEQITVRGFGMLHLHLSWFGSHA